MKALSSSQLDLDAYAITKDDTYDDDDDIDDDTLTEEDVDLKIELVANSTGHNDNVRGTIHSQGKPSSSSLIGRDAQGLFKNHANFLKLRNKINDQEQSHLKMFETINDKLSNDDFF